MAGRGRPEIRQGAGEDSRCGRHRFRHDCRRGPGTSSERALISTETGEVLSVAAATITKDEAIITLTGGGPAGEPGGRDGATEPKGQPVHLPFREDFSKYKDDETPTGWGAG